MKKEITIMITMISTIVLITAAAAISELHTQSRVQAIYSVR
jgi:hypothetical protein